MLMCVRYHNFDEKKNWIGKSLEIKICPVNDKKSTCRSGKFYFICSILSIKIVLEILKLHLFTSPLTHNLNHHL